MGKRAKRRRPSRGEVDPAALRLLERHGASILATARRYSASAEDAEDAYQRAFEILLTKAPTTAEEELVPWLKTVVKHEAFAIRRARERTAPVTGDGELAERGGPEAATHEAAEHYERLRLGAEAMGRLKPHEVRALLLRAEGYSYKEICSITGWTYTKVNRCLTEGRKAFLERVAGIEAGGECERLAPVLSALADGEASAQQLATLRPHLRSCLTCRSRLREFRAAPARVAALVPAAAVAAGDGGGTLRTLVESLAGTFGERAHAAAELATGQKVAAAAASAALLAGGGAGVGGIASHPDPPRTTPAATVEAKPVKEESTVPAATPVPSPPATTAPAPAPPSTTPAATPQPTPSPPKPPPPNPATEFAPGAPAASAAPAGELAPPAEPTPARRAGGSSGGGSSGGGGEFGP
jgi:RNA polymerase sigma factor (sigma-70 family)